MGSSTLDNRGNSAKKASQDKKGLSQDAKAGMVCSSDGYEFTSQTNGDETNFHISNKSDLNVFNQNSSQSN